MVILIALLEIVVLIIIGNSAIYEYEIDTIVYNTQNPALLYMPCFIFSLITIFIIWKYAPGFLKRKGNFFGALVIILIISAMINFIVPVIGLGYINYKYGSLKRIADGKVEKIETWRGTEFIHVGMENKLIKLEIADSKKNYHKKDNVYQFKITNGLWCSKIITPFYTD